MKLGVTGTPAGPWREPILGRVTRAPVPPEVRSDSVLVIDDTRLPGSSDVKGYAGVICRQRTEGTPESSTFAVSGAETAHLNTGDIVSLNRNGYVRTLYRVGSSHNVIFATDRCNSYCLMCSQPPKKPDESTIVAQHLRLLSLIQEAPPELGITGGEPTLLKDGFIEIVATCKRRFPSTPLHVLSNGRLFCYGAFARRLGDVDHPDLMVGVPLYGAVDTHHDYVVQARGAFDQTLIGLQNLGRYGVPIEIRVVIHQLTHRQLMQIAEFIYRNLTFASHVTFMGLEPMGFAIANIERLWIDPMTYGAELEQATTFLFRRGMRVSIYNHQLCTVPRSLWRFCRQSISDWKQAYLPQCKSCAVRGSCAGFFESSVSRGRFGHIEPVLADAS